MSGGSRRDLVIEMLNDAKTSKEKLHVLIQIKEIVLFREPALIVEIVPEVLEFMLERTASMRKFLVDFSGEALAKSLFVLPSVLNMYNYLVTDSNEDVVLRIAREIKKVYDKMVMNIVNIAPKTKQSGPGADPKQMWQHLRTVSTRLVDVISSDRGESMRNASLTLAEAIVIFGLPAPPVVSHDPRLKAQAGLSAENVPLHHPFINRNELEQEAEDIFKKMLLWTTRGGPQGHPFTPNQMSLLGQAIARIASQRPKKATAAAAEADRGSHAAKALIFMLQNTKANVCKDMSGPYRSSLAKATHGLLRSPFASMHDPEGLVAKLRAALATLEALGFEDTVDVASKKRGAGAAELDDGGEDAMEDKKRRDEALSALDAAEQIFKAKSAHADESMGSATGQGGKEGSMAAVQKLDTELAGDLAVPFEATASARAVLASVTQKNSSSGNSEVVVKLVAQSVETCDDLAVASLQRLLDSFYEIKSFSEKALLAHAKLAVRMAVSMALVAVANNRTLSKVPIVLSLPTVVSSKLTEGVMMEVPLPRPLWLLVSFVLSPPKEEDKSAPTAGAAPKQTPTLQAAVKEKMLIIMCLLDDLRVRAEEEGDAPLGDHVKSHPCTAFYESVCTVVLARLLQNLNLRDLAKTLLTGLVWIPRQCLDLLKLLMHTGTKAAATATFKVPGRKEVRNRGTRMEALTLLTYLVFAADQDAGTLALNHLLWCSVADDFETRSKAVTLLLNDVLPAGDWVVDVILSFALQAAGTLVGCDAVREGHEASADIRAQVWALPSEVQAAADKVAAERAAAEVERLAREAEKAATAHVKTEDGMEVAEGGGAGDTSPAVSMDAAPADATVEEPEGAKPEVLTLANIMAQYDYGSEFGSSFASIMANTKERYEANVRRSLQLLMQLCTSHTPLLGSVMDLAGAAVRALDPDAGVEEEAAPVPMAVETAAGGEAKGDGVAAATDAAAPVSPAAAPTAPDTTFGPKQQCKVIMDVLRGELTNIIPSIVQKSSTDVLFGYLARSDPFARPLLEHAVGVLHSDMHTPPTPRMIETINTYIAANHISPKASMRLTVSLIGGMPSAEVRTMLPHIISAFISSPEQLNNIFSRIVMARPPALSKSALLIALHRCARPPFSFAPSCLALLFSST